VNAQINVNSFVDLFDTDATSVSILELSVGQSPVSKVRWNLLAVMPTTAVAISIRHRYFPEHFMISPTDVS
jgi:hypothetical protein